MFHWNGYQLPKVIEKRAEVAVNNFSFGIVKKLTCFFEVLFDFSPEIGFNSLKFLCEFVQILINGEGFGNTVDINRKKRIELNKFKRVFYTGAFHQLVELVAHAKKGWPKVKLITILRQQVQAPSCLMVFFNHFYLISLCYQAQCGT